MQDRSFHRQERIRVVGEWSRGGVLKKRPYLPIEKQFQDRLVRTGSKFFTPVPLTYSDDHWYNTQVSYVLEACDSLPSRPDIAFDSMWKVFESTAVSVVAAASGKRHNITETLKRISDGEYLTGVAVRSLLEGSPSQTCEYLFKKVLVQVNTSTGTRIRRRLTGDVGGDVTIGKEVGHFLDLVGSKYGSSVDLGTTRRGSMLLRRALAGETLDIDGAEVTLSLQSRLRLLLGGLLYTARNERYHGEAFSPFYSSAASLKTYTHPHYLFLTTYALVHLLWARDGRTYSPPEHVVEENIAENLREARTLYGRHWTM